MNKILKGLGTQLEPYLIENKEDFYLLNDINYKEPNLYFKLENDIDFEEDNSNLPITEFKSNFDGNNKTLRIKKSRNKSKIIRYKLKLSL